MKNVATKQIQKVETFDSDRKNINLIPKNDYLIINFTHILRKVQKVKEKKVQLLDRRSFSLMDEI